jgi:probable F420-dependent oxidoreductase
MKFGIAFATRGPLGQPAMLAHLARTAEDTGIESIWTTEHVLVPVGYKSEYPYDPSGKMAQEDNAPHPDPLLPLAYAAAVTSKLKLATGVMILPQRHPAYVAKQVATLDVLSEGRMILGIGIGWLKEEFEALGIPFEERAGRTREAVAAIRSLWSEGDDPFEGRYYKWGRVQSNPKPVQPGGVPIVIGGHTDLSAKRAARYCDGYFPGRDDTEGRLTELLTIMREECDRLGRDPKEIEVTAPLPGFDPESLYAAQEKGVSRFMIPPPGLDADSISKGLDEFNEVVISKL